jgi:hypothetical protein
MKVEALTFLEALQSLARRYGITLPEHSGPGGPPQGEGVALALANQTAAEFFEHVLWKTDEGAVAREYLKARGISEETARAFMLGFAIMKLCATELNLRIELFAMELLGPWSQLEHLAPKAIHEGRWSYRMLNARAVAPSRRAPIRFSTTSSASASSACPRGEMG